MLNFQGRDRSRRSGGPEGRRFVLAMMLAAAGPVSGADHALAAARTHHIGGKTGLVRFEATPFPYLGNLPDQDRPFLDARDGDRLGHTSPRGGIHWQDVTYASKDVLVSIPPSFDPRKPVTLVVFFHGNNATLERDVWRRQRVVEQLARSHINAVLVAPQFAIDAPDSSAGNFWTAGFFATFLAEAATRVAAFAGEPRLAAQLDAAPVIVVAYSGGYNPAAYALSAGGAQERVCGVILLDALFGESSRFAGWIAHRDAAFFVSAYSKSSEAQNLALEATLAQSGIPFRPALDDRSSIDPAGVAFVPAKEAKHNDFVTAAWTGSPLRSLLSRVRPCRGGGPQPVAASAKPLQTGTFEPGPPPGPGGSTATPFGLLQHFLSGGGDQ